jgi:hypothetical protein
MGAIGCPKLQDFPETNISLFASLVFTLAEHKGYQLTATGPTDVLLLW